MPYSQFTTITTVKEAFNLTTVEGIRFLPEVEPIQPSSNLATTLEETLPLAAATAICELTWLRTNVIPAKAGIQHKCHSHELPVIPTNSLSFPQTPCHSRVGGNPGP